MWLRMGLATGNPVANLIAIPQFFNQNVPPSLPFPLFSSSSQLPRPSPLLSSPSLPLCSRPISFPCSPPFSLCLSTLFPLLVLPLVRSPSPQAPNHPKPKFDISAGLHPRSLYLAVRLTGHRLSLRFGCRIPSAP
ncbi:hypothetical protein Scep_005082 [Stephania cephalantha]|uniref:Uncharacterized protein n=1 Tax=Stephania cephalantha TaxID=152367 RepID=A0AAP0KV14_9MAGN